MVLLPFYVQRWSIWCQDSFATKPPAGSTGSKTVQCTVQIVKFGVEGSKKYSEGSNILVLELPCSPVGL